MMFSFKRKDALPARPDPPSADQICEDLEYSSLDDPIFIKAELAVPCESAECMAFIKGNQSVIPVQTSGSGAPEAMDQGTGAGEGSTPDLEMSYEKVLNFVKLDQKIQASLMELKTQQEQLSTAQTTLEDGIKNLKDTVRKCTEEKVC